MESFDLIVLGGGSAARDAANRASQEHGARVALVERIRWGGSCPNVACKPTKAYLFAADLAHDVNALARVIGVETGPARANLARINAWKESLRRRQPSWIDLLEEQGFEPVSGVATFVDAHTVRVDGRELSGDRILIATGSRTAVPPVEGIEDVDWIDHVSALDLTELPESLLVVGGGPVGLEFAQIFSRFGSRVTVVNRSRIAGRADADASEELAAALRDEGIELLLGDAVSRVRRANGSVEAEVGDRMLTVSRLLLASGRVPNTEELELDRVGVAHSHRGIRVDDRMRTTVAGIWAAGDVVDGPQFTPVAQYQARLAVDDMFGVGDRRADYSALPIAIFTDPELAQVGLTEEQAREQGHDVDAVSHPLSYVTRAQYTRSEHGLFKVVFDVRTRKVLGIHVVSRGASDVVQGLAVALSLGVTVDQLALSHHIYPSWGEGIKAAAEQALAKAPA
jgi:mercuric reductase